MDMTAHEIVTLKSGGQYEAWLVVHANGRLQVHVENDGYAFLRRGAEVEERWVDLDYIRQNWSWRLPEIEAALSRLQAQ